MGELNWSLAKVSPTLNFNVQRAKGKLLLTVLENCIFKTSSLNFQVRKVQGPRLRKVLTMKALFWHRFATQYSGTSTKEIMRDGKRREQRSPQCRADYPLLACSCSFNSHVSPPRYEPSAGCPRYWNQPRSFFLFIYFFLTCSPSQTHFPLLI